VSEPCFICDSTVSGHCSESKEYHLTCFPEHMRLKSAAILASRVSSDRIARHKTRALLGESMGLDGLLSDDEDVTEIMDGSGDLKRRVRQHMFDEAKSFRELEVLTEHLANIDMVSEHVAYIEE